MCVCFLYHLNGKSIQSIHFFYFIMNASNNITIYLYFARYYFPKDVPHFFFLQGSPPRVALPDITAESKPAHIPHNMSKIELNFPSSCKKRNLDFLHHEVSLTVVG